jgi:hypothetical protein
MPSLFDFISKGYFPRELPPPFETINFANYIIQQNIPSEFNSNKVIKSSKLTNYNIVRVGSLRRKLSIPNPIHYFRLSKFIIDKWNFLITKPNSSAFSLSIPIDTGTKYRALESKVPLSDKPLHRARIRAGSKYILYSDITRCYPSIYTHSIPWVLHGKSTSKLNAKSKTKLEGDILDEMIRNTQDCQTMGIPIGQDSSFLIAEIILSEIDKELFNKGIKKGIRNIDDYEFTFDTLSEAENALVLLQEQVTKYELELNPSKTKILELPDELENEWVSDLRTFIFRNGNDGTQKYDLIKYFDKVFTFVKISRNEYIISYAISRLNEIVISKSNWDLFEDLLLQCVIIEPGCLKNVIEKFMLYKIHHKYLLNSTKIEECFNKLIKQHALLSHDSEVAWSIWGLIELNAHLYKETMTLIENYDNPIIALLILDANSRGLIQSNPSFAFYISLLDEKFLYSEYWLLTYEAYFKKWLIPNGNTNFMANDKLFDYLFKNNISFYNTMNKTSYKINQYSGTFSSGGGGY